MRYYQTRARYHKVIYVVNKHGQTACVSDTTTGYINMCVDHRCTISKIYTGYSAPLCPVLYVRLKATILTE